MKPFERLSDVLIFRLGIIVIVAIGVLALSSASARRVGLAVPRQPCRCQLEPCRALKRTSSATGELTRDEILDNITLYWLTNTGVSASRLYWEYKGGFFNPKGVAIPVAVTVFPGEQYQAPRSWTERAYSGLIYYNQVEKGGHFAAWEQPQLFSEEIRAAFRSLR